MWWKFCDGMVGVGCDSVGSNRVWDVDVCRLLCLCRGCYRGLESWLEREVITNLTKTYLEGREKRKRRRSVGRIEAQRRIPEKCCDGRLRPSSVFWTRDYMRLFDIEVLMVLMEADGRVRSC